MIVLPTLLTLAALAPPFEVYDYPLSTAGAQSFIADADGDGVGDLCLLDGSTFTVYDGGAPDTAVTIRFPEDTTAIDIADPKGDGFLEIIALTGATVTAYPLVGDAAGQARVLFELEDAPPGFRAPPFLHVMAVTNDTGTTLLIPQRAGVVAYALDGTRATDSLPAADAAAPAFDAWVVRPSSLAGPGGLEIRLEHAWQPGILPGQSLPASLSTERGAGPYRLRKAAGTDPEGWPWVPLRPGEAAAGSRVFLAVEGDETGQTLVAVRRRISETPEEFRLGPVRRYPGQPLWQENAAPDFNGDGYTDLILWRTRRPMPTIGSLSRAITAGAWPVDISLHLFDPASSSFSPRAAGNIQVQTPIARFFDPAPGIVPFAATGDFNGDGFTDFACASAPDEYSIWLWAEGALSAQPGFTYRTAEAIRTLEFRTPLAAEDGAAIGLRTDTRLVLLRPAVPVQTPSVLDDPEVRMRIRYLRGLVGSP